MSGVVDPVEAIERDKGRFVELWHRRHSGLRAAAAVNLFVDSPAFKVVTSRWIEELRAEEVVQSMREVAERDACRAALQGVSRLLVRACEFEGLPLAAVAHGILRSTSVPMYTEGFPWRDLTSVGAAASQRAGGIVRLKDRWEANHYRDAAFVRPRVHPRGRWAVRQRNGTLHVDMALGAHQVRTAGRWAALRLAHVFPETVRAAMPGRRLESVVDHPMLRDPDMIIVSAVPEGPATRIRFECPVDRVSIGDLAPDRGTERMQLGRDGRLSGDEAMADVIARQGGGLALACPLAPALVAEMMEGGARAQRIRRIDLMCPPWAEPLLRR